MITEVMVESKQENGKVPLTLSVSEVPTYIGSQWEKVPLILRVWEEFPTFAVGGKNTYLTLHIR